MVTPENSTAPAFGQAQLSNCEREQIHLPGSIQPHGALVVMDESGLQVIQSSANAAKFLNLESSPNGQPAAALNEHLAKRVAKLRAHPTHKLPLCFRSRIGTNDDLFDCLLHRTPDGPVVAEFLRAGDNPGLTETLRQAARVVSDATSLETLCNRVAKLLFKLTGYDRVMVYEFDRDGHGRVMAEKFEKDLEPYLGNRYPATDIPQIARKLYVQNRIRLLADVGYEPVPVEPRLSPVNFRDLDMSMCFLRSISPIHIQYLKNMGVNATMVVSIVVGGKLWGLISCHHYAPRLISVDVCAAAELVAETMATRITALQGNAHAHVNWSVRRFESFLLEGTSRHGDWKEALMSSADQLLRPVDADGAALFVDGEIFTAGNVPGTNELREIRRWLIDKAQTEGINNYVQTASLSAEDERFNSIRSVASGILAVPVSEVGGEFLVWFRPEQIRTDTWGGNPAKAMSIGEDPADLSPRRSFAQWHELVKGTSVAWSSVELSLAERISHSVAELAMHFRSVRALIIEDQLQSVFQKVARSRLPTIIADSHRHIVIANEAFQKLVPAGKPQVSQADDLPGLFENPERVREHLIDLFDRQKDVRTEVCLRPRAGEPIPLLFRADPVFVAERRIIGYVLMFSDISEQKAVTKARGDFQRSIAQLDAEASSSRFNAATDERDLIATIVGNAKLAALDITDGQDVRRIPDLLDSVRASMERSLELLDHLTARDDGSQSTE
jgi:chemotaxis family two-component system sensor kinase Cph1